MKWVNKKCENFNIYNVAFFLKNKEKHLRYHCFTPAYQKSWWYDLQFLRYRVSQTEIGNYVPITPPLLKTWKIRILKKWKKNSWIYHHFTHVHQKLQSFEVWFLRYRMKWDRQKFLSFWAIFCPFTPPPPPNNNNLENQNFEKMKKHLVISFYTSVVNHGHMLNCS